ncbi:hypothetical protein [Xanthomonas albilineans]|uniref:hypothetical protein n=1 Tax=Xanthomonas albilineans TaxID=29447 RepID=UPI0027D93FDB|nr:hypothetical protein [Xanthomonas albilineans]
MNPVDQERADAANDSYFNRPQSDVDDNGKFVFLDGNKYKIFGYANDSITGFHATAYQSLDDPDKIIIAYRGTDPGLFSGETDAEKAGHALTTLQDIAVDATMVRDAVNPQKAAADAFTAQMLAKAAARGIPKDHVTVAGHSLGGALAQIEAAKYGLAGATFNAYGAVSLNHHVPEGGSAVTNYVLAGDPVSGASRHYGTVVTLATPENVQALKDAHYLDASHGASSPNPLRAMRLGDHSGTHFTGPQSVLSPERLTQLQANYAHNKAAFDHFRQDVHQDRELLNMALNPVATTAMTAKAEALAVQMRAEHAYEAGRQTVERGIHAVEHTAGQAYDTLTHPGQWFQQSVPAASIPPTSTNPDTSSSSSSSSAAASMPPPAMDRHTGLQDDHAFQQRQEHIRQAQQQAAHLAQVHRQTQPPPSHSAPVHEKPAGVDMQEQARIAQLQQHEQQAQAAREQQQRLAQHHAQLHRQAMEAQQHEHEQRHSQDPGCINTNSAKRARRCCTPRRHAHRVRMSISKTSVTRTTRSTHAIPCSRTPWRSPTHCPGMATNYPTAQSSRNDWLPRSPIPWASIRISNTASKASSNTKANCWHTKIPSRCTRKARCCGSIRSRR